MKSYKDHGKITQELLEITWNMISYASTDRVSMLTFTKSTQSRSRDKTPAKPASQNLIRDFSLTFVEVDRMRDKQPRKTATDCASNDNGGSR